MHKARQERNIKHGSEGFNFAVYEYWESSAFLLFYSHWHPEFEIIYVDYGDLIFEIDGKSTMVRDHQALIVDKYQIHSCQSSNQKPCHYFCIVFGEQFLFPSVQTDIYQKYIYPISQGKYKLQPQIYGNVDWEREVLTAIRGICRTACIKPFAYELELQVSLLTLFHRMIVEKAYLPISSGQESTQTRVRDALYFIHHNYGIEIEISEIARSLNISPEHFIRTFKEAVGKTPKQYLLDYRITCVKSRLIRTEDKISAIAQDCGFSDLSYFTKCFKRMVGCTANAYRQKHLIYHADN